MADTVERLEAVDAARWWIGWHPFASVFGGIAVGAAVGYLTQPWLVVVGAMVGIAAFVVGALYVNGEAPAIVDSFERDGPELALSNLDYDGRNVTEYTAVEPADSPPPPVLDERSEYTAYAVVLGDEGMAVYDGLELDLVSRSVTAADESFVFPYADVTELRYENHMLHVETAEESYSRRLPESLRGAVEEAERRRENAISVDG
jgi:hypothetical protein